MISARARRVADHATGPATWGAGAVVLVAMAASAAPSPLYALYEQRWHFSPFLLTVAYASYALAALVSLLAVGRVSDDIGRRPALLAGLGVLAASFVAFLVASSIAWLVLARTIQGLSIGLLVGAAGASLVDARARRGSGPAPGLINGVLTSLGLAVGAVGAAVLAAHAGRPLIVPFVVLLALTAVLAAVTARLPDTRPGHRPGRLRVRVPRVPAGIRAPFALSALGVLASWSVMGLLLALGPSLADDLVGRSDPVAGGAFVAAVTATGALAQVVSRRREPRGATVAGAIVLAGGLIATCAAVSLGWLLAFYLAAAVTGAGFGVAFFGALRALEAIAPHDGRAEVMAAFYVVAYIASSLPALAAGVVALRADVLETFQLFAAALVVLVVGLALLASRLRAAA